MTRLLGFAVFASIVAMAFPSVFERYRATLQAGESEQLSPPAKVVEAALPAPASGRSLQLRAGPDGHFRTDARFDGRAEPVLIDTGATYVAINERTARRLGINVPPEAFTGMAQTANGPMPVALAKARRIAIGPVEVRDVDVMVAKGEVLTTTLLGMSFLKRLKSFSASGDTLTLVP